jgi:hypothetical protein
MLSRGDGGDLRIAHLARTGSRDQGFCRNSRNCHARKQTGAAPPALYVQQCLSYSWSQ